MNEKILTDLIIQKHSKDICVPQCKTGASWSGRRYKIFDVWVMKLSWTNPNYYGYEIKVSRQDFLNDNKWIEYLPYCTEFYFVCPPGLISPDELPKDAGLMIASKNAKMLYIKKKAPYRDITIPNSILKYIIMWRSEKDNPQKDYYWHKWLEDKRTNNDLGYRVAEKIRKVVYNVSQENRALKSENEALQEVKEIIKKLGFDEKEIHSWNFKNTVGDRLKGAETGVPHDLVEYIADTMNNLKRVHEILVKG